MKWMDVDPLQSEELIDILEKKIGYRFPQAFRECVINNNGGSPEYEYRYFDGKEIKGRVFGGLNSFNPSSGRMNMWAFTSVDDPTWVGFDMLYDQEYLERGGMTAQEFVKRYIPFASDEGGNPIAFDTANDHIVWMDHEDVSESIYLVADDFESFLASLTTKEGLEEYKEARAAFKKQHPKPVFARYIGMPLYVLTVGETYEILCLDDDGDYYMRNNHGMLDCYPASRFELIDE